MASGLVGSASCIVVGTILDPKKAFQAPIWLLSITIGQIYKQQNGMPAKYAMPKILNPDFSHTRSPGRTFNYWRFLNLKLKHWWKRKKKSTKGQTDLQERIRT